MICPLIPLNRLAEDDAANGKPIATLICLHGWGANHRVWLPLAEAAHKYDLAVMACDLPGFGEEAVSASLSLAEAADWVVEAVAGYISQHPIIGPIYLVGWSLGGQFAALVAEQMSHNDFSLAGIATVASNPCFVEQPDGPQAMPATIFEQFLSSFEHAPAATYKRFMALQMQGAGDVKSLRRQAGEHLPSDAALAQTRAAEWLNALNWLREDTRPCLQQLSIPQLHILANHDALIPLSAGHQNQAVEDNAANQTIADWLGQCGEVQILESSHCLPLERPEALASLLSIFVKTHSLNPYNKRRIAHAFSAAAKDYDNLAEVQRTVAQSVFERFSSVLERSVIERQQTSSAKYPFLALDIGSGTGALSRMVASNLCDVLALDIAEGMLQYAKTENTEVSSQNRVEYVAGDAEQLPFADGCVNHVLSSLALQWCSKLDVLLSEISRVLRPGGIAVVATLGPATLRELKYAWQQVDNYVHVNPFASLVQWQAAIAKTPLTCLEREQQKLVYRYDKLAPLLRSIKGIGAHNSHVAAPPGLMTQTRFRQLEAAYTRADDGAFELTYDVMYFVLHKSKLDKSSRGNPLG